MFNIGPMELMLVLLIALVVVGPSRLPEVGRSIGRGLRELRKVQDEVRDSINFNLDGEPASPRPTPKPRTPRRTPGADEATVPVTPIEPEPGAVGPPEPVEPVALGTVEPSAGSTAVEPPAEDSSNGSTPVVDPPRE